ncbi:amidohydrolase family protein [Actinomadura madurae]|uniref:N-acetylglucosamine-6-phosphate deacetylase n=1 Tax=Actinomadura madurae TaxID=1993 RepID=UPI0020276A54|nr:amidohydrolase family protein [Actinomadura madurae]URN06756.1 amidohydrolase family protein [Actinomadura madurae]
MASLLITAHRMIITPAGSPTRVVSPGYVRVEDGVVAEAGEGPPPRTPDTGLPDGLLAPGLVDLQVNGFFGHDMADADESGWHTVVSRLPETGVTAFLPTFITAPVAKQAESLRRARDLIPGLPPGTRVLGVHLEGPFLSEKRKGAHNAAHLTDPEPEAIKTLLETGLVKLVTLAPERNGALDAIRTLTEAGVLVSVGHSDATAAQVSAAADAGARKVTHIFNAQSGVHHRDPGVAVQALIDDRLSPGLILDLHHVSAPVAELAFRTRRGGSCSSPTPRRPPGCRPAPTTSAASPSPCPGRARRCAPTAPSPGPGSGWTRRSATRSASASARPPRWTPRPGSRPT